MVSALVVWKHTSKRFHTDVQVNGHTLMGLKTDAALLLFDKIHLSQVSPQSNVTCDMAAW